MIDAGATVTVTPRLDRYQHMDYTKLPDEVVYRGKSIVIEDSP